MRKAYKRQHRFGDNRGIALLLIVLIGGSALLIISLSAVMLGLGEREIGFSRHSGGEAFAAADGCLEEVYRRIRQNLDYGVGIGSILFTLPSGSCTIEVTDLSGSRRSVDVIATVGSFIKHIRSSLTILGTTLTIDSWEERTD